MTVFSTVHILVERPLVTTAPSTAPSITFADLPGGDAHVTVTVMGDEADRRAFAAELRAAADFMDAWQPSAEPEPADDAAVPA